MKTFQCQCGNTLYFENSQCFACGRELGYLFEVGNLFALQPREDGNWEAAGFTAGANVFKKCRNYSEYNVCNWLLPADDPQEYCPSCRLNQIIPDLQQPDNMRLWYQLEVAKRRLLYTLQQLHLPIDSRSQAPETGLAFRFMADPEQNQEFLDHPIPNETVITGHDMGVITINISEADPSLREETRIRMNEQYRTLLGHFRHEAGHYYWDRLIRNSQHLEPFREVFGDERLEYGESLARYYEQGPKPDWQTQFISAYASAHPWEDWAESFAHYLHMVDTLETAHDYGFSIKGQRLQPVHESAQANEGYRPKRIFDELLKDWSMLTVALNDLNRSMGLPDAYPFSLTKTTLAKLHFIHRIIGECV